MMHLLALLGIPLLFYLPGYCLARLFPPKARNFELVFFEIAISILLTGLIAFVLAHLAMFSLIHLYALLGATCLISCLVKRPSLKFNSKKILTILIFAAIASSAAFLKPTEAFHGGLDPGVYLSTGVNIAKTGAILISSPVIKEIHDSNLTGFYQLNEIPLWGYYGYELPGFYITNPEKGTVTPQFYHMYSVWIAIFYSLFGLKGTLFVAPFFSLLSIVTIFLFVKKTFTIDIAILSTALIAISFAQVWYSLTTNSEILMQFYLFLTLYFLHTFTKNKILSAGTWSAFAAASGALTRIEFAVVIPVIVGFLAYDYLTERKLQTRYFFIPFALLLAYVVLAIATLSRHYTSFLFNTLFYKKVDLLNFEQLPVHYWPIIIGVIIIFFAVKMAVKKRIETSPRQKLIISLILWLMITLFCLLSHKLLPNVTVNLTTLSWYITPIGLFMGFLGLLIMPWNKNKNVILLLAICSLFLSLYAIKAAITPVHPWWVRRFLPVVLPGLIIGISYFIFQNRIFTRDIPKKAFAALLIAVIALPFVVMDTKIFAADEYDGLNEILSELNQTISEPAVVLYFNSEQSHKYATPLHYIYGKEILVLTEPGEEESAYIYALAREKNIYAIYPSKRGMGFLSAHFNLEQVYQKTVNWKGMSRQTEWKPHFQKLYYLPDNYYDLRHDITLYQLKPLT